MRRMSEMVQKSYTVYLKGSFNMYKPNVSECILTLMETCRKELFSLESLNMEVFPRNPCRAKVEFVVKAIGPTSYDVVFDDVSEILFRMPGEFEKFRIRTCSDPHKKSDEEGGAEA
jgi:hypothetical protein